MSPTRIPTRTAACRRRPTSRPRSRRCPRLADTSRARAAAARSTSTATARWPDRPPVAVNLSAPQAGDLHAVPGVRIGVAMAGIRKANRKDLVVFALDEGAAVAGVFTSNRFCAAPVLLCREHLAAQRGIRALLINTGNANAGTGADGLARARRSCEALAARMELAPQQVLPFSTGVIMEPLPVDRLEAGLPAALRALDAHAWLDAAEGIMTTDTVPKAASRRVA